MAQKPKSYVLTKKIAKHGHQAIIVIPKFLPQDLKPQTVVEIKLTVVKEAIKELQLSEIEKIFPTLSRHLKITILALCVNTKVNGGYAITYPDAYKNYVFNAKNEHFGAVGERQFRVYLDTLEMLGCFDFQWRSAPNRRGRVRIAIPKFDYISFLSRFITE